MFIPSPRYTQVVYNPPEPQNYNSAFQFVSAYRPRQPQPIAAQPVQQYFTPSQIVSHLSSQTLPGIGLRYFVPHYTDGLRQKQQMKREDDRQHNDVETNQVDNEGNESDLQWKKEKEVATSSIRKRASDEVRSAHIHTQLA